MANSLEEQTRDMVENAKHASERYKSATGEGLDMRLQGIEDAIHALARALDAERGTTARTRG
jgi:hypothetical protein